MDAERFFRDHHLPYLSGGHHHTHQGWVQTHCPFCTDGRHGWHLGVNLRHGSWNCWRCGPLNRWRVLASLLRTTDKRILAEVLEKYGGRVVAKARTEPRRKRVEWPPGAGPLQAAHRAYLRGRGYNVGHLCKEFDLLGTTWASGNWNWRVLVPVHNADGEVVAYQGRAIVEGVKPKYRMLENRSCLEDPEGFLYHVHRVPGDAVVVVEGVTGVWRLGPGAVATFGIDWHVPQANKLRAFGRRYILYDPEPKAQQRAHQLAAWLGMFPGVTEVVDGFRTDPGDFSPVQARRVMRRLGVATGNRSCNV